MPNQQKGPLVGDDLEVQTWESRRGFLQLKRVFTGWESIEFSRSIDAASGSFRLVASPEVLSASTPAEVFRRDFVFESRRTRLHFPIEPGDLVRIVSRTPRSLPFFQGDEQSAAQFRFRHTPLAGFPTSGAAIFDYRKLVFPLVDVFATGWVDQIAGSGGGARRLEVVGRDPSADLVDASIRSDVAEIKNASAMDICSSIAAGYGVRVALGVEEAASSRAREIIPKFTLQPTESCFSAIERVAREKSLVVFPDPRGFLVLSAPGETSVVQSGAKLTEGTKFGGQNVISYRYRWDMSRRFSNYTVYAQRAGNKELDGEQIAMVRGSAVDYEAGNSRFRELKIRSHKAMTPAEANAYALWQSSIRASRGSTLEVEVQGWRKSNRVVEAKRGELDFPWQLGELIPIDLPSANIKATMLLATISMRFSKSGGRTTSLGFVPRNAYTGSQEVEIGDNPFSKSSDLKKTPFAR